MKIAVVSLAYGKAYSACLKPMIERNRQYCETQGYDFILGGDSIVDKSRPISWSKILVIQKVLADYDWILWVDADAAVMNHSIRIDHLFKEFLDREKYLILTKDGAKNINFGVFLLKNIKWSFELLKLIWDQKQFINHKWWENRALIHLYFNNLNVKAYTHLITDNGLRFNCFPHFNDYKEGDFIIHFAGLRGEVLEENLNLYLK